MYPKVRNLRIGDWSHENGSLQPTFSGQAVEDENWFDGPLNDWSVDSDRFAHFLPVNTIPDASCAYPTISAS